MIGMKLRGRSVDLWKITTPLALALSFTMGASAAALMRIELHVPVLGWCGLAYLGGGLIWSGIKRWKRMSD
ncbi:hypothetical protein Hsar01_02312 [Haloferula sargassicola]|uniref:Uncharacterized protein n=2 Tax=Haloferula sargassicola TaxID=490096 RepID=A0ABP9UPB1_9BACT